MWYKNKVLWGVVIVVIVGWAVWHYHGQAPASSTDTSGQSPAPVTVDLSPKAGEVAVVGMLDCLPLKSGATPDASTCIIGVKADDGKIYALDTGKIESFDKGITQNSKVKAIGTSVTADQSSEEAKIYKYDSVLSVRILASAN